nr:MAG TPA: hypothetical protein [Caudoviricetes sp.]DAT45086.1 MAG TPA: hypothetical protein [Caudoviricetes sp.]DAX80312.1 MAG TPA: hypothetical protein [Caudoviricetes sp.]
MTAIKKEGSNYATLNFIYNCCCKPCNSEII